MPLRVGSTLKVLPEVPRKGRGGAFLRAGVTIVVILLGLVACQGSSRGSEGGAEEGTPSGGGRAGLAAEVAGEVRAEASESPAPQGGERIRTGTVEPLSINVLAVYPHDPGAFTQGLVWDGGVLYESTGLYGKSSLRRVEPRTGEVSTLR